MAEWDPEEHSDQLDELRRRFPGWQIWVSGPSWCARPDPLINADSAAQLAERIKSSHGTASDGSPPLASWRSYRARLRLTCAALEVAAATFLARRAAADARYAAMMDDPVVRFWLRHGQSGAASAEDEARDDLRSGAQNYAPAQSDDELPEVADAHEPGEAPEPA